MMRKAWILVLALAPAVATPAIGQRYEEQRRWDAARPATRPRPTPISRSATATCAPATGDVRGAGYGRPSMPHRRRTR